MADITAKIKLKNGEDLVIDKSWLKSLNVKRQSNTNVGTINYGVMPSSGLMEIIDKDNSLYQYITDGLLDNNDVTIAIYFNNKIVANMIASKATYNYNEKVFSVPLIDELYALSSINYPYRQLTSEKTAEQLLNELLTFVGYTANEIDGMLNLPPLRPVNNIKNIKELSSNYLLYRPYLNASNIAAELNKVCNILQVSLVQTNDGIKFVDSTNELNSNISPILIPFKDQYSVQDIPIFKENKIDKVRIKKNTLSSALKPTFTSDIIKVYENEGAGQYKNVWGQDGYTNSEYVYEKVDDAVYSNGDEDLPNSYYKLTIPNVELNPDSVITNQDDLSLTFTITFNNMAKSFNPSNYEAGYTLEVRDKIKVEDFLTTKGFTRMVKGVIITEDRGLEGADSIKYDGGADGSSAYYVKIIWEKTNPEPLDLKTVKLIVYFPIEYGRGGALSVQTKDGYINSFVLSVNKDVFTVIEDKQATNKNEYQYHSNELISYDIHDGEPNALNFILGDGADAMEYIANSLTLGYGDGLYTLRMTISCDDYYDVNGTKVKRNKDGDLIDLNDVIQIDNRLELFRNIRWKVTSVNFRYDGMPLLDIEAVELYKTKLEEYSWSEISRIAGAGKARDYFKVGDRKTFTLNEKEYTVKILDFDDESSQIVFGMEGRLEKSYSMGGTTWKNSSMRNDTLKTIYSQLSNDLQNVIKIVNKKSITSNGQVLMTDDKLWLLGLAEIYSEKALDESTSAIVNDVGSDIYKQEGNQYEYFKNLIGDSLPETVIDDLYKGQWWLRTQFTASPWASYLAFVYNITSQNADSDLGVSFCFCV